MRANPPCAQMIEGENMGTTPEHPQEAEVKEPELMKSLALGMVGDLGRLLKEQGLGRQPVKIVEALVFAMFVVTEAFVSAKQGLEESREALDRFHEDMIDYMFSEYLFKHQKAKDMGEVEARFQELHQLINKRYGEYRRLFLEDYQDRTSGFGQTLAGLYGHLFAEPLPEGEGNEALVNAFSVKLAHFWSGCVGSFPKGPA